MLNDKKDNNGFLNALNNIDDDLVEEVTETSVRPIRTEQAPKWSRLRSVALTAASFAAMAAVCVGVISVMRNLPSSPPVGGTLEGTSAVSDISESTDKSNVVEKTEPPVLTTAVAPPEKHSYAEEILSQKQWQYINYYHDATSDNYGINNFDNLDPADIDAQTGMVLCAVFDRKAFNDEYEIALLGFKVWTDNARFAEGTVLAKELRIALVKTQSDKIIATVPVCCPLSPDALVSVLEERYFDKYTEICDNIVIFRSLFNRRIPEALFFGLWLDRVDDEYFEYKITPCVRVDAPDGSRREDRSEILSPVIYTSKANITTIDDCYEAFIIGDELTETEYWFVGGTYTVEQKDRLHDEFEPFDLDSIPVIEEFFYDDIEGLMGTFAHDMVIAERKISGYTLSLVGNNFRRTENGPVFFYNPRIIIKRDIYHLASVPVHLPEMGPYHCAMIYSDNGDFSSYLNNAFMLGGDLFLFDVSNDGTYSIESIYCFNGDYVYALDRRGIDNTVGETPDQPGYELDNLSVSEDSLSFVYGFREYRLVVGDNGKYSYSVSWLNVAAID